MVIYALHKINFTETESKTAGLTSLFGLVIGTEKNQALAKSAMKNRRRYWIKIK